MLFLTSIVNFAVVIYTVIIGINMTNIAINPRGHYLAYMVSMFQ